MRCHPPSPCHLARHRLCHLSCQSINQTDTVFVTDTWRCIKSMSCNYEDGIGSDMTPLEKKKTMRKMRARGDCFFRHHHHPQRQYHPHRPPPITPPLSAPPSRRPTRTGNHPSPLQSAGSAFPPQPPRPLGLALIGSIRSFTSAPKISETSCHPSATAIARYLPKLGYPGFFLLSAFTNLSFPGTPA